MNYSYEYSTAVNNNKWKFTKVYECLTSFISGFESIFIYFDIQSDKKNIEQTLRCGRAH